LVGAACCSQQTTPTADQHCNSKHSSSTSAEIYCCSRQAGSPCIVTEQLAPATQYECSVPKPAARGPAVGHPARLCC
jgi:hypothetical protein